MLTILDLFSGIGAFSLGLERTGGFATEAFCEFNDYRRRVLAKHWPNVPIHPDVRQLRGADVGPVDVVCGGFPCQPTSVAGQRRGKADDRWLWPEMARVVAEIRPAWVLAENPPGIVGLELDGVLADLEGLAYAWEALVIPACAVAAPHLRERVWIVAHRDETRQQQPSRSLGEKREWTGDGGTDVPVAGGAGRPIGPGPTAERTHPAAGRGYRWRPEPDVRRVVNGLPHRMDRVAALGDSAVPQVIEAIGYAILAAEAERVAA